MNRLRAASSNGIIDAVVKGVRLSEDEALVLLTEGDLLELGQAADRARRERHPGNTATFIIDRNINYTNVCTSKCRFCAFYREQDSPDAYLLSNDEVFKKIEEAIGLGATQVMLQGGLHPDLGLDYFTELLKGIKERYDIVVHSFSPPEIWDIAKKAGLSLSQTLSRLKDAGLDSLPGGGAEILVDRVRERLSPNKISAHRWLKVMEEAHSVGMRTTATMMMGAGETVSDRLEHMAALRRLQDKTGGFRAFIPWTFQPGKTELGGEVVSSLEYLSTLSVARLFLDNFEHIQGSWVTQGKEIGQISLLFGADDLGSIMIEENVVRATGVSYAMSQPEMIRLIQSAGRKAALRNTSYEIIKRFD